MDFAERYARLDDETLIDLALFEATDLEEAAKQVLREEVARRRLPGPLAALDFISGIGLSRKDALDVVRSAPCPFCSGTKEPLNAHLVVTVRSFWGITCEESRNTFVGRAACANLAAGYANRVNLTSGWWSFPGLFGVPLALLANRRAGGAHRELPPSKRLRAFVDTLAPAVAAAAVDRELMAQVLVHSLDRRVNDAVHAALGQ